MMSTSRTKLVKQWQSSQLPGSSPGAGCWIPAPSPSRTGGSSRSWTGARRRSPGSRLLGVHLEGPFLSERRRGAHDAGQLVDPTPELVDRLMEAGAGILELLTLAPEREGAIEATKRLAGAGVLVSVGHSDALAEQVAAAAEAGARMVTHIFNAQRGLHHREPGVAGQALADARLACGLIADLHHVHPAICRVVMEAARGRVALVTDAVSALGMPPGRYELGSEVVELHEGSPPLRADGTLAGSTLRLDEAVGNVVGLSDSWRALATWVDGNQVWEAR